MSDPLLEAQAREGALLEGIHVLLERAKTAEAELERATTERGEARRKLDAGSLARLDRALRAEAERDRLREALREIARMGVSFDAKATRSKQVNNLARAALAGGTDANAIHAQAGSAKVETGHNPDAAPPEQKP